MNYRDFVLRICSDGEAEVKRAYTDPNKIAGALDGFAEARQTVDADDLKGMLKSAHKDTADALEASRASRRDQALLDRYWFMRMRELQIEWVANVVSASAYNRGLPTIVTPTLRGWEKAAEILGRTS